MDEPLHSSVGFAFPKQKFGSRYCSCQSQWFQEFSFLHYDVEMDVVFCYTCVKAATQKKILKKMPGPAL